MTTHQERFQQYLAHAEDHVVLDSYILFNAKNDCWLAEEARLNLYKWIGKAQDQHQEDHF